jgi:hypothetical protein
LFNNVVCLELGDWGVVEARPEILVVSLTALFGTASTNFVRNGNPVLRPFFSDKMKETAVLGLRPRSSAISVTSHHASLARGSKRQA